MTRGLEIPPGKKLVEYRDSAGRLCHRLVELTETSGGGVDGDTQAVALSSTPASGSQTVAGSNPARRSPKQQRKPNKTEAKYACEFLIAKPGVDSWGYEQIKLRLGGEKVYYVPDFFVMRDGKPELHEVKASHRFAEKGKLKWRWARDSWGHVFKFVFAMRVKGGWEIEE